VRAARSVAAAAWQTLGMRVNAGLKTNMARLPWAFARSVFRPVGFWVGWLLIIALGALWALRLEHLDAYWLVVFAIAVWPWLSLLSWIVTAIALATRLWALAAVAAALVVISLWTVLPQWSPIANAARPTSGDQPLRVFDANVEFTNQSLAGIAGEIEADRPDVVTLEELSDAGLASLTSSAALVRYQWRFVVPASGADGFGVWSDVPISGAQLWFAGLHPEVRCWLDLPEGPRVRLYVVHTVAPRSGYVAAWQQQMRSLQAHLKIEQSPLLVVGDFNATWDMYEFQDILHQGLRDAAVEQGKGWEMSWSRQVRFLPPAVRIDHILYSSGITSTQYRSGVGRGSDHRPIIADLAVSPPGLKSS
jgi:endonuclease/exonuclease/phosphatase (EEP) superfamily protein YafD